MKGFLAWHDRPFRKTHDLVELGHACTELDGTLGVAREVHEAILSRVPPEARP